jgi:hypothetical protein
MDEKELVSFLETLVRAGWEVKMKTDVSLDIGDDVNSRYSSIPDEYLAFLRNVSVCRNQTDTVWFLCEDHYAGKDDSAFLWNDFEIQSLKAAGSDEELIAEIKGFWHRHFPFLISVKYGYAFLAMSVSSDDYGVIVSGREPEYEEVIKICGSFQGFTKLFSDALKEKPRITELNDFL